MLDAALYSGISYWASTVDIVPSKMPEGATAISECLTRGSKIKIYDTEDEKWLTLTLKKFLKGVELYDRSNFDDMDAADADCIVQLALFGEVVYA